MCGSNSAATLTQVGRRGSQRLPTSLPSGAYRPPHRREMSRAPAARSRTAPNERLVLGTGCRPLRRDLVELALRRVTSRPTVDLWGRRLDGAALEPAPRHRGTPDRMVANSGVDCGNLRCNGDATVLIHPKDGTLRKLPSLDSPVLTWSRDGKTVYGVARAPSCVRSTWRAARYAPLPATPRVCAWRTTSAAPSA